MGRETNKWASASQGQWEARSLRNCIMGEKKVPNLPQCVCRCVRKGDHSNSLMVSLGRLEAQVGKDSCYQMFAVTINCHVAQAVALHWIWEHDKKWGHKKLPWEEKKPDSDIRTVLFYSRDK